MIKYYYFIIYRFTYYTVLSFLIIHRCINNLISLFPITYLFRAYFDIQIYRITKRLFLVFFFNFGFVLSFLISFSDTKARSNLKQNKTQKKSYFLIRRLQQSQRSLTNKNLTQLVL